MPSSAREPLDRARRAFARGAPDSASGQRRTDHGNSIASAQRALDEGIPFDAAVVDLRVADGNASALVQGLSERGIPVVITTGYEVDRRHPALSTAVAFLQKPHGYS